MHVMDGDCEKTSGCLAAEGAPELGLKDKHGVEPGAQECQDIALEDSKSLTANENGSLNGDHDPENEVKDDTPNISPDIKEEQNPEEEETSSEYKKELAQESVVNSEVAEASEQSSADRPEVASTDYDKADSQTNNNGNSVAAPPEKEVEPPNQEPKEEKDETAVVSAQLFQSEMVRRKRSIERDGEGEVSSGSESETGRKRLKGDGDILTPEPSQESQMFQSAVDDERERVIREFIDSCTQSPEEMARSIEKLHKELNALGEMARAKELEWNSILRVRKLKEEMLERILRKKRQSLVLEGNTSDWGVSEAVNQRVIIIAVKSHNGNNQMMVPIVSSSPNGTGTGVRSINAIPPVRMPEVGRQHRPILPKPYPHVIDPGNIVREGRNGPILDVKSIIADYRLRHPENVPRRGRRVRGEVPVVSRISSSPALISMANMALGSGANVRTTQESPYTIGILTSHPQDGPPGMSFKDVLVQFAKLSQSPTPGKPPPPYPEVTLHPVNSPQSPPTSHSSLLHGILTKSVAPAAITPAHRPATFSPTLARLLTAPEKPSPSHQLAPTQISTQFRPPTPRVSITDILTSSKKSRNEITITPVTGNPGTKSKDEVVLLDDDDETGSGDGLVIDEGGDAGSGADDVPQCQGCRQKSAQFVCAGCGNQWYCSRECQVGSPQYIQET
ncbi:hypothetical protein AAG570_000479 [Ranatra chinensis]|uniref:MYND-type domain-containing protein n=1 Tax=Ranatra chinensis TaxID=642074 RepID=A0ABD0ZKG9_9HEMI